MTRWSPLRKFWQRKAKDVDIVPIKSVARHRRARQRGARAAGTHGGSGRRLPHAAVPPLPGHGRLSVSGGAELEQRPTQTIDLTPQRVLPTFTGTIGPDITFFGFPVTPEALATHWVVLEEPPAGYRFYQKTMAAAGRGRRRPTARRTSRTSGSPCRCAC